MKNNLIKDKEDFCKNTFKCIILTVYPHCIFKGVSIRSNFCKARCCYLCPNPQQDCSINMEDPLLRFVKRKKYKEMLDGAKENEK